MDEKGQSFNRLFVIGLFGCACVIALPALVLGAIAMNRLNTIDVCPPCAAANIVCAASAVSEAEGKAAAAGHSTGAAPAWSYEGSTGPDYWGTMEGYEVSKTGKKQSPINIVTGTGAGAAIVAPATETAITRAHFQDVSALYPNAYAHKIGVHHTGHGVGTSEIDAFFTKNSIWYKLLQFHFHTPSEHSVDGFLYDAEIHFVHQRQTGEYLVIGLFIREGDTTPAWLRGVMDNLPEKAAATAGGHRRAGASASTLQDFNYTAAIEDVIGSNAAYYTYAGSFTTPPCTEAVTWIVLKDPIRMTSVDLVNLKNAEGVNNRPVLPLNERTVYYKA